MIEIGQIYIPLQIYRKDTGAPASDCEVISENNYGIFFTKVISNRVVEHYAITPYKFPLCYNGLKDQLCQEDAAKSER